MKLEEKDIDLLQQNPEAGAIKQDIETKANNGFPKLSAFEISLLVIVLVIFSFIGLLVASSVFGFELPLDVFNLNRPRLAALPPYTGVFLYEKGTYFDVQQHIGLPDKEVGIPTSSLSEPVIVFWQVQADPKSLQLIFETGEYVPIKHFSGRSRADIFQPEKYLQPG